MSLDKSIQSGKEHRKPYRKSKVFDRSCRNHGPCGYCESNRRHSVRKSDAGSRADFEVFLISATEGD